MYFNFVNSNKIYKGQGRHKVWKSRGGGGAQSILVGIDNIPPGWDRDDWPKTGGLKPSPPTCDRPEGAMGLSTSTHIFLGIRKEQSFLLKTDAKEEKVLRSISLKITD